MSELLTNLNTGLSRISPELTAKYAAKRRPEFLRKLGWSEEKIAGYTDDVDDRGYGDPAGILEDERGFADPLEGVDQQSREDILTAGGETNPSVVIDNAPRDQDLPTLPHPVP